MARKLRRSQWKVLSVRYSSINTTIQQHAEMLADLLRQEASNPENAKINLVSHSLGSIIIRGALAELEGTDDRQDQSVTSQIARIVMLAPPHGGSHVARCISRLTNWFCPIMGQLSDSESSYVNRLGNPFASGKYQLGIVRSTKDRVIAQDRVDIAGSTEMIDINVDHGLLPWSGKAQKLVLDFLENGCFQNALQVATGK